jgi:threonine synthase
MKKTSFYKSSFLSNYYNSDIYLKEEFHLDTQSHKDRWAKQAILELKSKGIKKVLVCSSGNLGLALAFQAKKEGLSCRVISWSGLAPFYKESFEKLHAELILVQSLKEEFEKIEEGKNEDFFSLHLSDEEREKQELIASEAFEEIAFEIFEASSSAPDYLIVPAGFGDLAKGIFRGFEKLKKEEKITKLPSFLLVRAKLKEGPLIRSITTDTKTAQVKEVLLKSKGREFFPQVEEFQKAQRLALEELGINLELSSAGVIAVLEEFSKEELKGKEFVLILSALEREALFLR